MPKTFRKRMLCLRNCVQIIRFLNLFKDPEILGEFALKISNPRSGIFNYIVKNTNINTF
jgi:hypothetical protein